MPDSELDLSIIVTLMDDRGQTEECMSSWTRGQTYARDRYEVIVVGSGREVEIEAAVRPLLAANDRLLRFEASNELALHNFGARRARGKWLLFTEAHCAAEPDCLAELMAYLRAHESHYAGACIRTTTDNSSNVLCQLEERWYRDGFASWSREDDWRKVTIRGTAVLREAYGKVGGFKTEFGCFSEILLAAELDACGFRLGYAKLAAVKHYNSTSLHELLAYVREYREGEVAFHANSDASRLANYFEQSETWDEANLAEQRLALKCASRSLVRAVARPLHRGPRATTRATLAVLVNLGVNLLLVGRARMFQAAVAYAYARVRFAWPCLDADIRYRRFCQLWDAAGELARRGALLRRDVSKLEPTPISISEIFEYRPGEMPFGALIGFHRCEISNGQQFRWSTPVALVRVSVPPGDYNVRVETKGISGRVSSGYIDLYLDSRPMRRVQRPNVDQITFNLDRAMFRHPNSQTLVFVTGRFRTAHLAETRKLGIPVFSITFTPRKLH